MASFKDNSHKYTALELRNMFLTKEKRIASDIINSIKNNSRIGEFELNYTLLTIENKRSIGKEEDIKPIDDKIIEKFNKEIEELANTRNIINELRMYLSEDISIDILYIFYAKKAHNSYNYDLSKLACTDYSASNKDKFIIQALATDIFKIKDIMSKYTTYSFDYETSLNEYYYDEIYVNLHIKWR
jgi:hypothetical protein